ncbi:MAG: hypothetical protein P9L92_12630 [Candidatus Electryonea clarkiae]|nr:hypothetical protein [Candidatus Electryonea clarkiae]MDP8285040.1 hypothetical protein [Candidatus Electryonea clarkiae]
MFRILVFASLVLLCAFNASLASAGDPILKLADSLAESGYSYEAITEYKRFIFHHYHAADADYKRILAYYEDEIQLSDVYYSIAMAYREMEKWDESIASLEQAIISADNDSIRGERKIDIAVTGIAAGNYSSAAFNLTRIATFSKYPQVRNRARFNLGICYIYTYKWEEAFDVLSQYYADIPDNKNQKLKIFSNDNYPTLKNPDRAKWLSTFLPGSGQMYAGAWWDGINSLLINGGIGYMTGSMIYRGLYSDALIVSLGLLPRFYQGNRYNAQKRVEEFNEEINKVFAKRALNIISNEYSEQTTPKELNLNSHG